MAKPSGSGFRFPAFRVLKQELGAFDAICENLELGVRELLAAVAAAEDGAGADPVAARKDFIEGLSRKHRVRVNTLDPQRLRVHAIHLYIVSVHHNLEEFLLALKKEHPRGGSWDMAGEDDRLRKVATNIGFKATLAFELCQYYREVRNAFAHPAKRERVSSPERFRVRVAQDDQLARLSAPNAFKDVTFDDFILFSRAAKQVAQELCVAGRPSDAELLGLADEHARRTGLTAKLAEAPDRLAGAKAGYLRMTYALSPEEASAIVALGSLA